MIEIDNGGEEDIMSNERYEVHSNNMDIVQRLMAEKMIGQFPLKALDLQTARVKNVLSTD